jgi:hypothetical protein
MWHSEVCCGFDPVSTPPPSIMIEPLDAMPVAPTELLHPGMWCARAFFVQPSPSFFLPLRGRLLHMKKTPATSVNVSKQTKTTAIVSCKTPPRKLLALRRFDSPCSSCLGLSLPLECSMRHNSNNFFLMFLGLAGQDSALLLDQIFFGNSFSRYCDAKGEGATNRASSNSTKGGPPL